MRRDARDTLTPFVSQIIPHCIRLKCYKSGGAAEVSSGSRDVECRRDIDFDRREQCAARLLSLAIFAGDLVTFALQGEDADRFVPGINDPILGDAGLRILPAFQVDIAPSIIGATTSITRSAPSQNCGLRRT